MIFKFDKEKLVFTKTNLWRERIASMGVILCLLILIILSLEEHHTEKEIMLILQHENEFSEKKFVNLLEDMNFRFPYIVYAQSVLETGNFKSTLLRENNNLFGMRNPVQRINLSNGAQNGYAYYNTWIDSVYDYAFYSSTYLSKLKTEQEYLNYLQQYYAEDSTYISKLKKIMNQKKDKFK